MHIDSSQLGARITEHNEWLANVAGKRNLHVTDSLLDEFDFTGLTISFAIFERCFINAGIFVNVTAIGCRFKDCYMRGITFNGCNFSKSGIKDSFLTDAVWQNSDISYVDFDCTDLESASVVGTVNAYAAGLENARMVSQTFLEEIQGHAVHTTVPPHLEVPSGWALTG